MRRILPQRNGNIFLELQQELIDNWLSHFQCHPKQSLFSSKSPEINEDYNGVVLFRMVLTTNMVVNYPLANFILLEFWCIREHRRPGNTKGCSKTLALKYKMEKITSGARGKRSNGKCWCYNSN